MKTKRDIQFQLIQDYLRDIVELKEKQKQLKKRAKRLVKESASVAQVIEHSPCKGDVAGLTPATGSTYTEEPPF